MTADSTRLFVALRPCEALDARVRGYKRRLLAAAGPQMYATDPPHATLYVASYATDRVTDVIRAVGQLSGRMATPEVVVDGWHVFESDPLTGLHTLVCRLSEETCDSLRRVQLRVLSAIAPLRDPAATLEALGERLPALSVDQQRRAALFGFPYVGGGWMPHLTIASVRPSEWPHVRQVFNLSHVGQVSNLSKRESGQVENLSYGHFTALDIFELHGLDPRHLASFALMPRTLSKAA